jgi:hypothetical protein
LPAVERAFHLLLNALHRTSADGTLARDLAYALAATQVCLDAAKRSKNGEGFNVSGSLAGL